MNKNLIHFLIKLKNASLSQKEIVKIESSKICIALLEVLYNEGYIQSFQLKKEKNNKIFIVITLRYFYNKPILRNLHIISKPSSIKYMKLSDICKMADKRFVFFFSTSKGFMTSLNCKKNKIGGKLLFMC